jgi:hypothetical protein
MVKITKVLERHDDCTVVEVQVTVRTVIREGRDTPDMTFVNRCNGDVDITDDNFILQVHEALNDDPILAEEMSRICD